ncbi:hypothetical protein P154DRAFT_436660 [Amniculicola lignicola CBS 123094]|uniref:Uncharacterized protein n=1 Tax=Amniculicola lignicola CBS 123094 TaxID=1392246 RepID=A0A6A5WDX2_9PLEO|nr:hypothetical protein P154DRAFT_436660 [Amniculicola lignicola CBS 123094]
MFEVDYRRSYSTLWKYVVQFLYNQDSPNNGKDGSCLDLPDSIQTRIVRVAAILQEALGQNVQREIDQSEIKHEQPTIRAVGFLCSNIIHIGPQYSTLIGSFRAEQEWHFSWEKHYPKPADLAILRAEADKYLSRLLNMGDEDLARIQAINSSTTVAWHVETDPGNPEPYLSSFFTEKYNEETGRLLAEPMICLGTNHLVALVPPTSKNGDVIVRFWRSSTAIVLRPVPRGFLEPIYALIGRAYVLSSEKTHMMLDTESQDLYATAQRTGRVFMDTDFRTLQAITASTCE